MLQVGFPKICVIDTDFLVSGVPFSFDSHFRVLMYTSLMDYRYAYSEETGNELDEEGVSLTSGAINVSVDKRDFQNVIGEALAEEDKRE